MPSSGSTNANIVVIGAGIIGTSVAYHLADMGIDGVTVVDKGDLDENDGSTATENVLIDGKLGLFGEVLGVDDEEEVDGLVD